MVLFKGLCEFRQHIKNKPHDTGLKYYSLCDQSKYLYHFWLYKGKKEIDQPPNNVIGIIENFIKVIPEVEGRRILFDNYYGSLKIGEYLNKKIFNSFVLVEKIDLHFYGQNFNNL